MNQWAQCVTMLQNLPKQKRQQQPNKFDADAPRKVVEWMEKNPGMVNLAMICRGVNVVLSTARRAMWMLGDNGDVVVHKVGGRRCYLYTLKED